MIEIVEKFLEQNNLNNSENTFLVGFSGGCDSLCLIDILSMLSHKYGFKVVGLHLNHNWRGDESLLEELNCKKYCEAHNIDFVSKTLSGYEQKTENIARDARYAFFLDQAKIYPNSALFTGHTSSDNAETIIYRIAKGTGVLGLRGIPEKRMLGSINVFRPLLSIPRKLTEDYCTSKGLIPNTDSSNFDTNYKRNFIRHKIMPLFKEINFNAEKAINSLSKMAVSQTNIVNEYIDLIMKDVYKDEKLLTSKFTNLSEDVMKKIIHNACLKFNLDYDLKKITNIIQFIKSNANSKSGSRYSLTNDLWVFANSKFIYLITSASGKKNLEEIIINQEGEWKLINGKTFSIKKFDSQNEIKFPNEQDNFAYVEIKEPNFTFTIRTRREGDIISPFGMSGSMKLKKYLNSKAISQHEKDELIMLCQGNEILWVVGVGLSNKLKVVNRPTHVLRLE